MTVTPVSGTYLVWFTGSVDNSTTNSSIFTSIYSNGAQVASSERNFRRGGSQGNVASAFDCAARVTVNGSQAIEGRWRVDAGTGSMYQRSLMILKVA
jgi:hypothetical protein